MRYPIIELRQYALRPGQREVLIGLFDRELVESQEALGMAILGQFRDLDDPDRFVWLRGFTDMPGRAEALTAFYGGPVWKAHSTEANATMVDVDNVLLLRPAAARTAFPPPADARPPVDHTAPPRSAVLATVYYRDRPFDGEFLDRFDSSVRPALLATGAAPVACLQTEYAENTFPALPIRTGVHAFVWFARFPDPAALDDHLHRPDPPALSTLITRSPQRLRLTPTARSLLR